MTHDEKLLWMLKWCRGHEVTLELTGECGFGRECVGISKFDNYLDYEWSDEHYDRVDNNGDIWTPPHSYHKHPCVAVLGRGEQEEAELYDWLKWFDDNSFTVETGDIPTGSRDRVEILLKGTKWVRMVKRA